MLIRPPELKIKCGDLAKAFRELKPDCGTSRIGRYNSQIPAFNYLGIRSDCIFCIDKDKEEFEYKSIDLTGEGSGLVFVLPHIIRDILKVTDKDSVITLFPHSQHKENFVTIYADGCTWELKTIHQDDYPITLMPPYKVGVIAETAPEVKQLKPVRNSRKVTPENNEGMDIDWSLIANITNKLSIGG